MVEEVLSSLRVVKAFGREDHEQARFFQSSRRRVKELMRVSLLQGGFDLAIGTTIAAGTAAALYVGVLHVRSGKISTGDLLLVVAYLAQLYEPLRTASKKWTDIQGSMVGAARAFSLLDDDDRGHGEAWCARHRTLQGRSPVRRRIVLL